MLEPPEDCEMNEMTLPSRDRIRNSILGRARYLSVTEARPQYFKEPSDRHTHILLTVLKKSQLDIHVKTALNRKGHKHKVQKAT